jgi:hypothetical protein
MAEVRDVVKDQLGEEAKRPLTAQERAAAKQLFEKVRDLPSRAACCLLCISSAVLPVQYDSDNNGTIDNSELRNLLKTEFKMKDSDVDAVMSKFDSNKDGTTAA